MKLATNMVTLMNVTEATNTAQTGTSYKVSGTYGDDVAEFQQNVHVYFAATQTGGATSPTTQIKLQTSMDNTNWIDLVSSTQLTADSSKYETKDHSTPSTPLCKYVRAITVLGGGTVPNHTATVMLISDGALKIEAA